jgi:hypothetical protein
MDSTCCKKASLKNKARATDQVTVSQLSQWECGCKDAPSPRYPVMVKFHGELPAKISYLVFPGVNPLRKYFP